MYNNLTLNFRLENAYWVWVHEYRN